MVRVIGIIADHVATAAVCKRRWVGTFSGANLTVSKASSVTYFTGGGVGMCTSFNCKRSKREPERDRGFSLFGVPTLGVLVALDGDATLPLDDTASAFCVVAAISVDAMLKDRKQSQMIW